MEASLGSLVVSLNANTVRFEDALTRSEHMAKESMDKLAGILGVGLSIGGITELVKSSIEAADHLANLSKSTGITVDQLAGLQLAARKTGSDLDTIALSVEKLSVNMGKDAEKFKALGVSAKDPLKAFEQLSNVLVGIEDPQKRAAVAAAALGKGWMTTAPLLMEGGDAIAEMVQQGTSLSGNIQEMADRSQEFNDKMDEMSMKTQGMITDALVPLLPMMLDLANYLDDSSVKSKEAGDKFEALQNIFKGLVLTGTGAIFVIEQIGSAFGALAAAEAAILHGDFGGAKTIFGLWKDDLAKAADQLDVFEQKILNSGTLAAEPKAPKHAPSSVHTTTAAQNKFIGGSVITGYQTVIQLEKDFQLELLKRQQLINSPLMSAPQAALAVDLLNIGNRAQTARVELEKLNLTGTLSLSDYHRMLKKVSADEAAQKDAISALAAQQYALNASWEYGAEVSLRKYLDQIQNVAASTEAAMTKAFKSMEDALVSFVQTGKLDFSSLANSIIADLIRIQVQQQITGPLAGMMSGMMGAGSASSASGWNMPNGESIPSAKGSWFADGAAHFALGGIVNSPTQFRFADGGTLQNGLMGEAGPEAIMPLKRAADGSLGIVASGSGKSTAITYAPVIHIDSRTDQAQVAQLVHNSVQQGNAELVDKLQRMGRL